MLKKLSELGFIADSSVYPGGYDVNAKGVSKIDFRKINHFIPYWSVHNNNVLSQQYPLDPSRKMIEIPIFAYPIRRVFKYDVNRIRVNIDNWSRSLEKLGSRASSPQKKTFREKLDYLIGIEHITWDFCLFSKPKMRWFIKRATEIMKCSCYRYHPFVLIGHSKAFFYDDSLRLLLSNTGMRFLTLSDVVKNILENPSQTN